MKLVSLILICFLFFISEIILFVILPEKTDKIVPSIALYILSILVVFIGCIGIYNLGKFWNMESQVRFILGVCCVLIIFISFIFTYKEK